MNIFHNDEQEVDASEIKKIEEIDVVKTTDMPKHTFIQKL